MASSAVEGSFLMMWLAVQDTALPRPLPPLAQCVILMLEEDDDVILCLTTQRRFIALSPYLGPLSVHTAEMFSYLGVNTPDTVGRTVNAFDGFALYTRKWKLSLMNLAPTRDHREKMWRLHGASLPCTIGEDPSQVVHVPSALPSACIGVADTAGEVYYLSPPPPICGSSNAETGAHPPRPLLCSSPCEPGSPDCSFQHFLHDEAHRTNCAIVCNGTAYARVHWGMGMVMVYDSATHELMRIVAASQELTRNQRRQCYLSAIATHPSNSNWVFVAGRLDYQTALWNGLLLIDVSPPSSTSEEGLGIDKTINTDRVLQVIELRPCSFTTGFIAAITICKDRARSIVICPHRGTQTLQVKTPFTGGDAPTLDVKSIDFFAHRAISMKDGRHALLNDDSGRTLLYDLRSETVKKEFRLPLLWAWTAFSSHWWRRLTNLAE